MRNADLDDLKDEQYAEQVKQERKEVDAMTIPMTPQNCDNCKFYDNHGYSIGLCHAKAPTTNEATGNAVFPHVYASCFCGEWSEYVRPN